ncbi:MAG: hypothetical protein N3E49_08595 [Bacteroidia bacterium]|nr:hypothetical protein [Bacteroidia bacterium]
MDRLRLPSSLQAKIGGILLLGAVLAQSSPLKKPNTFRLESLVREGEEGLLIRYEIPYDGVIELRLLNAQDSVVYFFQWPSPQGRRERRLPQAKGLQGSYRYRITYKGIDYTGQVSL